MKTLSLLTTAFSMMFLMDIITTPIPSFFQQVATAPLLLVFALGAYNLMEEL